MRRYLAIPRCSDDSSYNQSSINKEQIILRHTELLSQTSAIKQSWGQHKISEERQFPGRLQEGLQRHLVVNRGTSFTTWKSLNKEQHAVLGLFTHYLINTVAKTRKDSEEKIFSQKVTMLSVLQRLWGCPTRSTYSNSQEVLPRKYWNYGV